MKIYENREDFYRDKGMRLRKIGERSGDKIGDEYKPKPQIPKRQVYYNLPMKQKRIVASEFSQNLKEKATFFENTFRHELLKRQIRHLFQFEMLDDSNFVIADFYIPKLHLVIEIDGGYHDNTKQRARDNHKNIFYKNKGLIVLRITNKNVIKFNYDLLKSWYDKGVISEEYSVMFCATGRRLAEKPKQIPYREKEPIDNSFQRKKKNKKRNRLQSPSKCKKCKTKLIKTETKGGSRKPNQLYGYKYTLRCPKCKMVYLDLESKFYF